MRLLAATRRDPDGVEVLVAVRVTLSELEAAVVADVKRILEQSMPHFERQRVLEHTCYFTETLPEPKGTPP